VGKFLLGFITLFLQDFSHVHSFKGHEDRVTAVVFVDGGEPLCASADKGGVICIWGAKSPFDLIPRKKLFEPKDWRYSGIHALAISGTQYLYSGSGDRTIKAWSLQAMPQFVFVAFYDIR
jgi:WD40 repeat protein